MQSNTISNVVVFRGSSGYLVGVNDSIRTSYSIILSIYPLARKKWIICQIRQEGTMTPLLMIKKKLDSNKCFSK